MRRLAAIVLGVVASIALLASAGGAGGEDGTYEVRGIFDNAGFLVEGEEVRIAGGTVGVVSELDVTGTDEVATEDGRPSPGKAVVVMRIDNAGFQDFRADASCLIRPQSLIGEKFVECEPTQPRAAETPPPPSLEQIPDGEPGEGQYLLPLERNGKAVDLDLVNNIMEEPYPDRFRLILNNLGAGLAARGEELAEIVERGNPALRETNEVLAVLGRQNRVLAQLASDSDAVISALARERTSISGFINESETVGAATAERSADLEETFARFPSFLRELRSTMGRLDAFSTAATPVLGDLGDAAPTLTRTSEALGPFSNATTSALVSLGKAANGSGPNLVDSDPVIRQVRGLAEAGAPAAVNLRKFLASLRKTDGFRDLTRLFFNASGAVNPFDQYGHFIRGLLPTNNCVDYEVVPEAGCGANFAAEVASASARRSPRDPDPGRARRGPEKIPAHPSDIARENAAGGAGGDVEIDPGIPVLHRDLDVNPIAPGRGSEAEGGEATGDMRAARDLLDFLIGVAREPRGERRR